jgi:hypothetical protein
MNIESLLKENPCINITINAGDLLTFGQSIATQTANTILEKHDEKVYSRDEVIEKFHICSATLWRWDKLGLINSKKIGNRRFYAESEIKQLMNEKGNKL